MPRFISQNKGLPFFLANKHTVRQITLLVIMCFYFPPITGFASEFNETSDMDQSASNIQRVMSEPLEPLLPCAKGDDLRVWVLKAQDGRNIQLAIECRDGVLKARMPASVQIGPK